MIRPIFYRKVYDLLIFAAKPSVGTVGEVTKTLRDKALFFPIPIRYFSLRRRHHLRHSRHTLTLPLLSWFEKLSFLAKSVSPLLFQVAKLHWAVRITSFSLLISLLMDIPRCNDVELREAIAILVSREIKPDDQVWQDQTIGRLRTKLGCSKGRARDVLVRTVLALDFLGRNGAILQEKKVLAIDPARRDMSFSPLLLSVLARSPASETGIDSGLALNAVDALLRGNNGPK